jgi:hypothetical protein
MLALLWKQTGILFANERRAKRQVAVKWLRRPSVDPPIERR